MKQRGARRDGGGTRPMDFTMRSNASDANYLLFFNDRRRPTAERGDGIREYHDGTIISTGSEGLNCRITTIVRLLIGLVILTNVFDHTITVHTKYYFVLETDHLPAGLTIVVAQ